MITRQEVALAKQRATDILKKTGLILTSEEIDTMEVADFGLSELDISGAQILTLVNTDQIAVKLLVMLPNQTEPEHTHVRIGNYNGKEETIRCEWGELYLFIPGEMTGEPKGSPPAHRRSTYTVWHEVVLQPGEQTTLSPNTPHWFQGGPQGAVIWSFSTKATDGKDVFSDSSIVRQTVMVD